MKPPLEFYVMARSYNSYGGHPSLSLISSFLLIDAPVFGTAVSELTVTLHFASSGPPRGTLENLYSTFNTNLLSLPKVAFRRKRGQVGIDIASNLIDASDFKNQRKLSLVLFRSGVAEVVTSLELLKSRLTPKDDFSLDAFLAHCRRREAELPDTDEALMVLKDRIAINEAAIRDAMTPWERLAIDWGDFHHEARRILDDPFFWEAANDFSPHGNDTGADLLPDYRRWLKLHPSGDPLDFYHQLLQKWGITLGATDSVSVSVCNDARVALAFAELKLRADCYSSTAILAIESIQKQRQEALSATDWPHRDDRLKSLDLLEAKLKPYI